jgi:hypothetical protein
MNKLILFGIESLLKNKHFLCIVTELVTDILIFFVVVNVARNLYYIISVRNSF